MTVATYRPGRKPGRGSEDMVAKEPSPRVSCRLSVDERDWQRLEALLLPGEHVQDVIRRIIAEAASGGG